MFKKGCLKKSYSMEIKGGWGGEKGEKGEGEEKKLKAVTLSSSFKKYSGLFRAGSQEQFNE